MNAKSVSAAVMADIMAGLNTRRAPPAAAAAADDGLFAQSDSGAPARPPPEAEQAAAVIDDGSECAMLQLSNFKISDFSGKEDLFFRRFVTTQVCF